MPKIFGTNLLGILAAGIAFWLLGFLIYGILFHAQWLEFNGISEADAMARMKSMGAMMYVWGLAISIVTAFGLAFILNHAGASKLSTCAKITGMVALLLVLPGLFAAWLYEGRTINAVLMDFGHLLVGYVLMGVILSFFRGKDAIGD